MISRYFTSKKQLMIKWYIKYIWYIKWYNKFCTIYIYIFIILKKKDFWINGNRI